MTQEEETNQNVTIPDVNADVNVNVNADADADANADAPKLTPEEAQEQEEQVEFLSNLCILPPRSRGKSASVSASVSLPAEAKDSILLPPISPAELVSGIKGAISEIKGYAHITNYRLVVEAIDQDFIDLIIKETEAKMTIQDKSALAIASKNGNGNGNGGSSAATANTTASTIASTSSAKHTKHRAKAVASHAVVSPYTCDHTCIEVVSTAFAVDNHDEIVLNDYEDLSLFVENGDLHSNMGLRIVLERYNDGAIKDHVEKTRFMLDGNAPSVLGVAGATDKELPLPAESESEPEAETNGKDDEESLAVENKNDPEEKKVEIDEAELEIPLFPPEDESSWSNGKNLEDFFYLACGEEERLALIKGKPFEHHEVGGDKDGDKGKKKSTSVHAHELAQRLTRLDERCRVDCTIAFGGFNPPPPQRRLLGDLAYLEIGLPGGEDAVHITVIPTGFYVNRSNGSGRSMKFDPTPATQPCFSHELLDCLLLKSAALRKAWVSERTILVHCIALR